ncbi:PREDICTED: phosphatidylserine decarboxylase proenzyme [Papilio xuthus]|uniref:phosphatidylserine decarboxylase n=1 Tax=Papilio xuthus TaxID=66420 RepID=A0A194QAI4_PAPXU|nr:PREDICTED: phosphatidylserine decarboxylase proenzyme [Papilio xuthus]KPJ00426.1 Phosphatidylserine decarboxylase proenzyme [Papilio xuthus]
MFPPTRLKSCLPVMNPMFKRLRPHRPFRQTSYHNQTKVSNTVTNTKWMNLRAIITRWVPLGSVMYVGWCYIRASVNYEVSKVEIKFYEMFPFRITSRLWGRLAACELPTSIRNFVYGTYVRVFNVNLNDAAVTDLKYYKSLSAFFTRPLREGARYISPSICVSPCDGVVLNCGPADTDKIEQVKGVTYSLEEFLGENKWSENTDPNYYNSLLKDKNNILHQCIIYLAPGDYHRFHSPCDWTSKFRRHFSGKLLSVNPWMARLIPGLFTMNERAVYIGEWKHGFFSMTAVGATNVGSIEIYSDPNLRTNTKGKRNRVDELNINTSYCKGELFGQFNMGSTIILLFEAPKDFKFEFKSGERVLVGQALSGCAVHTR